MKRILMAAAMLLLAACASPPASPPPPEWHPSPDNPIAPFSAGSGAGLRSEWKPFIITRLKRQTQYRIAPESGQLRLHARAAASSSGLMHALDLDPYVRPWLHWQWRVERLIAGADNFQREREDSPVRILLAFDGDKDSLPFADQIAFETARLVTGRDMPYATLMYVWENRAAVGTVIPNRHSGRVKMVVAASGPDDVGKWQGITRNIVTDFIGAFKERPGRLIGIGVMTDTDNTGETAEAWYGDIRFVDPPVAGLD